LVSFETSCDFIPGLMFSPLAEGDHTFDGVSSPEEENGYDREEIY